MEERTIKDIVSGIAAVAAYYLYSRTLKNKNTSKVKFDEEPDGVQKWFDKISRANTAEGYLE